MVHLASGALPTSKDAAKGDRGQPGGASFKAFKEFFGSLWQVWTLDQIFGTFYVYVPIRATVLKVAGGLLVYAPVAATEECLSALGG